ncbi:unnamed protein product, partial [Adineta ricciae]
EDCLTLNIFVPKSTSSVPKAIMVFSYGMLNQIGSVSSIDGSAFAALGDVIVIMINYRLSIFGFLSTTMSGNYGLYDQLLALEWISLNAKQFNGDFKRITYVGHSSGAVNALLLAMSNHSDGLLTRVIAQSGCPMNQWAVDRHAKIRFDNVIKENNMNTRRKFIQTNMDRLKTMPVEQIRYRYRDELEELPAFPFPVVDDDIIPFDLEHMIRTGHLKNIDVLIGVTADESLSIAEEHIFSPYLSTTSLRRTLTEQEQVHSLIHFRKHEYIKKFLQVNHPEYLCFYDEIRARYTPMKKDQHNVVETTHLYTDLISDLMIYYDLIRFLHERLRSESVASTYVYYYTNPPSYKSQRNSNMVGHFAELDLLLGLPFLPQSDVQRMTTRNLSYTSDEIALSLQMIRYWTNFAKTGNPNSPNNVSLYWPSYETTNKSYINFHVKETRIENQYLEERFRYWDMISHRQVCLPFHWYHTFLLVSILILTILLIIIYIFYNTKRSRRNIKPTELTTRNVITTYDFLPSVVT